MVEKLIDFLQELVSSQPSQAELIKLWVDIAQAILTSIAIIVGGAWVWFKFLSRREFRKRLEPKLIVNLKTRQNQIHLIIQHELRSISYSKTVIESAAVVVDASVPYGEFLDPLKGVRADWRRISAFKVFKKHDWIEFDEVIRASEVVTIPEGHYLAFKVEMVIYTKRRFRRKPLEWNTDTIVFSDVLEGEHDEP